MRSLLYRLLYRLFRARRPRSNRILRPLRPGDTVLYLQLERPLGCCVHGTPVIDAIHAVIPGVQVIAVAQGIGADTLRFHPGLEQVLEVTGTFTGSFQGQWAGRSSLKRRLRQLGIAPDVIVQDASSRRGSSALLAASLCLAPTVGFGAAPPLYDCFLAYDSERSLLENNLRLAGALGGSIAHREPAVYFSAADLERARALVAALGEEAKGSIAFVMQGSGGQRTAWHPERFAAVVQHFEGQGYDTFFLGVGTDEAEIQCVRNLAGARGRSLAGQTTIPEAAAILALCDLLITVDTGTMHLGRAVGVPMVVLGPSWQRPLEWLPINVQNASILRGADRDGIPENYLLDEIGVAEVQEAAHDLLARFPATRTAREERVRSRLSDSEREATAK